MNQDIKDYLIERGEDVEHMEKHWSESDIKDFSQRTKQTIYFKGFMLKREVKAVIQSFRGGRT